MKSLIEYIQEQKHNFIIGKKLDSSVKSSNIVIAEDKDHLKKIIKETTSKLGFECDLNFIDVSNVTDMSNLFARSRFNGDISRWNVSNVTNMNEMFNGARLFNGDISKWDVSNVVTMNGMFYNTIFFDKYESIIENNLSDNEIIEITKKTKEYQNLLLFMYYQISFYVKLKEISFLTIQH